MTNSVIGMVLHGAVAVGEANSVAPNFAKAKAAAAYLMMLIKREPSIDNLSQEGESPVSNAEHHKLNATSPMQAMNRCCLEL